MITFVYKDEEQKSTTPTKWLYHFPGSESRRLLVRPFVTFKNEVLHRGQIWTAACHTGVRPFCSNYCRLFEQRSSINFIYYHLMLQRVAITFATLPPLNITWLYRLRAQVREQSRWVRARGRGDIVKCYAVIDATCSGTEWCSVPTLNAADCEC